MEDGDGSRGEWVLGWCWIGSSRGAVECVFPPYAPSEMCPHKDSK